MQNEIITLTTEGIYQMQNILIILFITLFGIGSGETETRDKERAWPEELNTASSAGYLSELEQEVIHELNKVRSNPKRYAEQYMEELRSAYKGKLLTFEGQIPIMTQEGITPLNECIRVLKKTPPLPILQPAKGLAKAAQELVQDQQRNGKVGHVSSKGANPQKRIEKYGKWDICASEDISYGDFNARQIVIALLIDDGVPTRGHRENILNPCTRFAGVAKGSHPTYKSMCVIDYAGNYKSN
ncbi:MAG TPA: CAP domain-containing protein [Prolixibacteraceae bacterium]|nr:CAP domain-containing protein [Prolixibacteraceae bacterium]